MKGRSRRQDQAVGAGGRSRGQEQGQEQGAGAGAGAGAGQRVFKDKGSESILAA
jgi:hypothetical protein